MKLDITSTVVEKGIDLAKDFLGKLIGPAMAETGLLITKVSELNSSYFSPRLFM